jgi:hypothetical protein
MKTPFLFAIILTCGKAYSQDTTKIHQIDSLVFLINNSSLPVQRDTIKQNRPEIGLKMTTYLAGIVHDNELLKYSQHVNSSVVEDGSTRQMNSANTFYYDHNKLIKVEEYITEGEKHMEANWYYLDDKPVYWTLQSERSEERANFLLTLSKAIQIKVIK